METEILPKKGKSHRLRQGRTSIPGHYYLVTARRDEASPAFNVPEIAAIILNALKWLEEKSIIGLEAAVVMPTHIHFVARLRSGDLSSVMQSLKGCTAREINRGLRRKGSIWQSQFHDHAIRRDEELDNMIRYCLENPVRSGLVKDFHDYPYWYCRYRV